VQGSSSLLFNFQASGGSATITGYKGPAGAVVIPTNINGLTVTAIGESWPVFGSSLTGVVIPASVTSIAGGTYDGDILSGGAFVNCYGLTNVTILGSPNIGQYAFIGLPLIRVYIAGGAIGIYAFQNCTNLTNLTLGDGVTSIGLAAFSDDPISSLFIPGSVTQIGSDAFFCPGLTNVIFAAGVASIDDLAFGYDYDLTNVVFLGNAPAVINSGDLAVFVFCPATVYYLPGTTGWSNTFGTCIYYADGAPTVLWNPVIQTSGSNFGVRNGQFGFDITGNTNIPIVVEACTNLANPVWTPLANGTLTNGSFHFSEPLQPNSPARYYGIGFP
jgi:hypothetical protein